MLQQQRPATEELPRTHPEALPHLPELPEGVVVPDDLSALELRPTRTTVRWLRWAVVVVLAVGAAVLVALLRDGGGTEEQVQTPAYRLVQDEVDQALAEHELRASLSQQPVPAYRIVQDQIDHATMQRQIVDDVMAYYESLMPQPTPAYRIVQDQIDQAVDHATTQRQIVDDIMAYYESLMPQPTPAYRIIQDQIDQAIAQQ